MTNVIVFLIQVSLILLHNCNRDSLENSVKHITFSTIAIFLMLYGTQGFAQLDFGDAPDPLYPTLLINNGANHVVGPIYLGNQIDIEVNGQPTIQASGDDVNGLVDDEDGIRFTTWVVPGQTAILLINTSAPGFLDAWIDFQANGNWSDPGDQIFTGQPIGLGQTFAAFNVPVTAIAGLYTYGRFRFSSIGGLQPTGFAPDGEVEDYNIVVGNPPVGNVVMDIDAGLSYTQNEISMTLVPVSGNLISAYNDEPYLSGQGIGVSFSTDKGQTWNPQQLVLPFNSIAGVPMLDAFDPSIASDDSGHAFVAQISTDFNWSTGPVSGLFVHKSTDGGATWMPPVTVDIEPGAISSPDPNYRFNDRCQIRVDQNSSSPFYNNIYITWIKDRGWNMPQPYSDIYVSVSSDGGNNFSGATQINNINNSFGNMPIQAIASNGDIYVLWVDYNVITGGNGILLLDKSTDGGVTWGTDIVVDTIPLPPINLNGGSDARAKGAAILRTHPTNPNELYIVYSADPDGIGSDEADIFFIKTTNGGASWSNPLRLNDDVTINDQVLPWMEVKSNGIIDVVWYDRRNDPSDLLWDVYATTSIDGGANFIANNQVNATSFSTPQTKSGAWLGEYLALTVSDSIGYVAFTSSSIDTQGDVMFTSFNNPIISSAPTQNVGESSDLKLYPNPTNKFIHIKLKKDNEVLIELYDYTGKLILSSTTNKQIISIDMTKYPDGIYLVKMTDSSRTLTKKFIKN